MNKKIAVIVITYNRLELIKKVIAGIRSQTHKLDIIYVINNSSTDGTDKWLAEQKDLMVIMQTNTGSSGGQYIGFRTAFEAGYDYIWTMDDDVVPEENCLEILLRNIDESTIHAPLRYKPDGKPYFNDVLSYNLTNPFISFWKGIISESDLINPVIAAVGITFEGPLVPREVVEKVGFPEKNFFIYGDDTEYFIRAWKAGFKIYIVRDAKLNRLLEMPSNEVFTWKHYYFVRNIIAIDVLHGDLFVRVLRPIGYLLKWLAKCKAANEFKTVVKAFFNGYFYKSGN